MEQLQTKERNNKSIQEQIVDSLSSLINDYKSGVPEEIKHSTSKDSKWKVRKAWFTNLAFELNDVLNESRQQKISISERLIKEISDYCQKISDNADNAFKYRLTNQEDIKEAENIIDKVIAELNKKEIKESGE